MNWHVMTPARRYAGFGGVPFGFLERELNRAFDGATAPKTRSIRMDVREDAQAYHIAAELPGLGDKDVEVTFEEGVLSIRGDKKIERHEKDTLHIAERVSGAFARQLSLPAMIDAEKIEARFDKGVLMVTLPKQPEEQAKAKKIEVKTH